MRKLCSRNVYASFLQIFAVPASENRTRIFPLFLVYLFVSLPHPCKNTVCSSFFCACRPPRISECLYILSLSFYHACVLALGVSCSVVRVSFLNPPMFMCNDIFAVSRRICFVSPVKYMDRHLAPSRTKKLSPLYWSFSDCTCIQIPYARANSLSPCLSPSLSLSRVLHLSRTFTSAFSLSYTLSHSLLHTLPEEPPLCPTLSIEFSLCHTQSQFVFLSPSPWGTLAVALQRLL